MVNLFGNLTYFLHFRLLSYIFLAFSPIILHISCIFAHYLTYFLHFRLLSYIFLAFSPIILHISCIFAHYLTYFLHFRLLSYIYFLHFRLLSYIFLAFSPIIFAQPLRLDFRICSTASTTIILGGGGGGAISAFTCNFHLFPIAIAHIIYLKISSSHL